MLACTSSHLRRVVLRVRRGVPRVYGAGSGSVSSFGPMSGARTPLNLLQVLSPLHPPGPVLVGLGSGLKVQRASLRLGPGPVSGIRSPPNILTSLRLTAGVVSAAGSGLLSGATPGTSTLAIAPAPLRITLDTNPGAEALGNITA